MEPVLQTDLATELADQQLAEEGGMADEEEMIEEELLVEEISIDGMCGVY